MKTTENALSPGLAASPLSLDSITWVGEGLVRPECVLATAKGDLYSADWRGGVAHIKPDGQQILYPGQPINGEPLKPNGIALLHDGSFLVTHLGAEVGGVFKLHRNGQMEPFLREIDGVELPPTNFVTLDAFGRVWITVSTRTTPRALGYRRSCQDGFIVLVDDQGARVVADGLGYTNECLVNPAGNWLYVNETFSRKLSRLPLRKDGSLGEKQVVTEFGEGIYPDGLAFDADGGVWVVSIVSNSLIRVAQDGSQQLMLSDSDSGHVAWVEAAFETNTMGRPHLDSATGKKLKNISSLAFGGPDLKTGYLGCLLGDSIAHIKMGVSGYPPVHWSY